MQNQIKYQFDDGSKFEGSFDTATRMYQVKITKPDGTVVVDTELTVSQVRNFRIMDIALYTDPYNIQ